MKNWPDNEVSWYANVHIAAWSRSLMIGENRKLVDNLLNAELEKLWRFALQITRDEYDAEDLVQQTCLRAIEMSDTYVESGKSHSWLFKIAQNIWINELRSRKIRDRGYLTPASEHNGNSRQQVSDTRTPEAQLELLDVVNAVESLPEAQRIVIYLVTVEGFSYAEAASILDVPIGTIMSRLARGRLTLGKLFSTAHNKAGKLKSAEKHQSRKIHLSSKERHPT